MATATISVSHQTIRKVFHDMPASLVEELELLEFTTNYPPDAVLFREREASRGVFLVVRGRVKLSLSSREGKTLILRVAGPSEVLGVCASVSTGEYEATAEDIGGL